MYIEWVVLVGEREREREKEKKKKKKKKNKNKKGRKMATSYGPFWGFNFVLINVDPIVGSIKV